MSRKPSRAALGAALKISKSQISKRIAAGMPDASISAALEWSKANVRPKIDARKADAGAALGGEYAEAKSRDMAAVASMRELELTKRQGELVDRAGVERAAHAIGRQLNRTLVEVWPSKVSVDLAAITDPWEVECFLREQMRTELGAVAMTPADMGAGEPHGG